MLILEKVIIIYNAGKLFFYFFFLFLQKENIKNGIYEKKNES